MWSKGNANGYTPLMSAAQVNRLEEAEELLTRCACVISEYEGECARQEQQEP